MYLFEPIRGCCGCGERRSAREGFRQAESGFTLIELLVVIAIIAILAGLLVPVLAKAKAKGQSAVCFSNIHQVQPGWFMFPDEHEDTLAPNEVELSGGVYRSRPGSWILGNAQVDTSPTNIVNETRLLNNSQFTNYFQHVAIVRQGRCEKAITPLPSWAEEILAEIPGRK